MKPTQRGHSRRGLWQLALDGISRGLTIIAGVALFLTMLMMTAHVVGRKLGHPVPGAFEFSEQLMILVFAFPLAEIARKGDHIRFELLSEKLGPLWKRRLAMIGTVIGILLFLPLTYEAWRLAAEMYVAGEYRQGMMNIPIWPFRVALAIGLSAVTIKLLAALGGSYRNSK